MTELAVLDLAEWAKADDARRTDIARQIDAKLCQTGVIELFGHGVQRELRDNLRAQSRPFFAIAEDEKAEYRVNGYGNGWRGRVRTSLLEGTAGPPDLHEVLLFGATSADDTAPDYTYYPPNKWPRQTPRLREAVECYTRHMQRVAGDVLRVLATSLGLSQDAFARDTDHATWTLSVNWYPSLDQIGVVAPGQLRVAAHSDLGTVSILDRQPGVGGLEVWHADNWLAPPYHADSLLVLLGDLTARWTGGRWNAVRHRVLPPNSTAPTEELVSLVFFFEANPDAVITPLLVPPGAAPNLPPVVAGEWIRQRIAAIQA